MEDMIWSPSISAHRTQDGYTVHTGSIHDPGCGRTTGTCKALFMDGFRTMHVCQQEKIRFIRSERLMKLQWSTPYQPLSLLNLIIEYPKPATPKWSKLNSLRNSWGMQNWHTGSFRRFTRGEHRTTLTWHETQSVTIMRLLFFYGINVKN